MDKFGQKGISSGTPPPRSTITTPQDYVKGDYSEFIMHSIMSMQQTLGQLTQAVTTLTEESKKNTDKIETIGKQVYAAKVVVTIVGSIVGGIYVLCEIWKVVSPLLKNP